MTTSKRFEGEFVAAAIEILDRPSGLVGSGTIAVDSDGLLLVGPVSSQTLGSTLGCLGAIAGLILTVMTFGLLGLRHEGAAVLFDLLIVGGAVAGLALSRRLRSKTPKEFRLAWSDLHKVTTDGSAVVFRVRTKPRGLVRFRATDPKHTLELVELLRTTTR